jgi:hypothetical protein
MAALSKATTLPLLASPVNCKQLLLTHLPKDGAIIYGL